MRSAAMAEITLRTDPSELAALAAFVERFAATESLSAQVAFQLNLVLEELVVNSAVHGRREGGAGTICIRLERCGEMVDVDLVDDGVAFDPRTLPAPDLDAPLEERDVGGLGVFLVRQLVDELDYRREDGRNHLRLRKRVTPGRGSDEGTQRG
jgi:anti-sigma regulatory factor (Ser/Thr protein kinase)